MLDALKGLFSSKTFYLAVIGSAVITALAFILPIFGLGPEMMETIITWVAVFFGIKGVQQGMADWGKSAKESPQK